MQPWLVYQIQISVELMTKSEVNKLMNKEKNEAALGTRHTNITVVMQTRILLRLRTFLIIFSLGPIYHVVIVGK